MNHLTIPTEIKHQLLGMIDGACLPFDDSLKTAMAFAVLQGSGMRILHDNLTVRPVTLEDTKAALATVISLLHFDVTRHANHYSPQNHQYFAHKSKMHLAALVNDCCDGFAWCDNLHHFVASNLKSFIASMQQAESASQTLLLARPLFEVIASAFIQLHPAMCDLVSAPQANGGCECSHN